MVDKHIAHLTAGLSGDLEDGRVLQAIKGKWLLSYNDDPYIRKLYQKFNITAVNTTYTLSGTPTDGHELLIRNY